MAQMQQPETLHPITEEQIKLLNSFKCERLSKDQSNLYRIQFFESRRGRGLVYNLKAKGWSDDTSGSVAYYVIKNPRGQIVMFFSLKCGVLFDPNYVLEFVDKYADQEVLQKWYAAEDQDPGALQYFRSLERKLPANEFNTLINELKKFTALDDDKQSEPNDKIIRVKEGHAAIELVEFCNNDMTKMCWNQYDMPPYVGMGETLFWWFIVPKMLEISDLIGCEYAFLFAADSKPDGFLMQYYENRLHFHKMDNLGTVKPFYDLNCYFMGQRLRTLSPEFAPFDADPEALKGLDQYREAFFADFNRNKYAADNI